MVTAQYVPVHISNHGIYDFLDELASLQVIEMNTALKPYSRSLICKKLMEAEENHESLNQRQLKELLFYLKDYAREPGYTNNQQTTNAATNKSTQAVSNHPVRRSPGEGGAITPSAETLAKVDQPFLSSPNLFHYQDTSFSLTVNPILGGNLWSNANGAFNHWWNGVETYASYGGFAMFVSVRDNHESTALTTRDYMNQRIGASNYKIFSGGKRDYWEVRGGMTYQWDWGHVGLMMDQFSWGDARNGAQIFSGRTPAFTRAEMQLNPADWLQINYVHGWLVSEVVDSTLSFWVTNSYGSDYRKVYHPKFMAANHFTFKPFKHFYLGVGNSVIYDYRSPHAAFFIPVMFWKALDHTLNARINNMNSQIFFTLSSRNIRGLHLYGSVFIDEVQVGRIFREGEYNFTSYKIGATSYQLPNVNLTVEYTWSNSLVFRHFVPTTTFESNRYNLGHFLEDNARDYYAAVEFRPWRTLMIKSYYNLSQKGPDHTLLGTMPRTTHPPVEPVVWESRRSGIIASLQVINNMYLRLGYEWRDVTGEQEWIEMWTPEEYWGRTGTMVFGINYGF